MGRRPPRPAAAARRWSRFGLAARRVVRDRPHQHPRARADRHRRLAGEPPRGEPRAGREGPAAELVPGPVAGGRDPHRRHPGLRHHAAPAGRGGRQQADLLRQQARLCPPRRVVAQHAPAHRARHPRDRRRHRGRRGRPRLRPLRRPARRLDPHHHARGRDAPAAARAARQLRADPRRPPLRRPVAAPDEPEPRRPRPAAAAARAGRRDLERAQQARRPRRRHPRRPRDARPAARGLHRPLRRGRGRSRSSSVVATEQRVRRQLKAGPAGPGPRAAGPGGPAAAPEHAADRIPHGLRAAVPPPVRRGLRKLAGKERS